MAIDRQSFNFTNFTDATLSALKARETRVFLITTNPTPKGKEIIYQLPVNPESFRVSYAGNDLSDIVFNLGEITLPQPTALATFTLDGFYPASATEIESNVRLTALNPQTFQTAFTNYFRNREVFRFVVTGNHALNMLVTIQTLEFEQRGGEPWDIYYTMQCKEFREYAILAEKTTLASTTKKTLKVGATVKVKGRTYGNSKGGNPKSSSYSSKKALVGLIKAKPAKNEVYPVYVKPPKGKHSPAYPKGWVKKTQLTVV